jgi:Protein of unknown function (DUF3106)
MLSRASIVSYAAVVLLLASWFVPSTFAQAGFVPPPRQQHRQPRRPDADGQWHHFQKDTRPTPIRPPQNQPGHAGNWLRNYKDMSPAQQHRALESDPQFRRLPPQQQVQLQKRLQHFSALPPQQQERVLNRMETWEHLTHEQKQLSRQLFQQFKQLPPERRQVVNRAIRGMRGLSPEQRDQLINSDQYRNSFSPQERNLLSGASRLPLAPGDGLQAPPEE